MGIRCETKLSYHIDLIESREEEKKDEIKSGKMKNIKKYILQSLYVDLLLDL